MKPTNISRLQRQPNAQVRGFVERQRNKFHTTDLLKSELEKNEMIKKLTTLNNQAYATAITAQSVVGISNLLFKSVQALIRSAFFMPTQFMVGCIEALRSADLLNGITNSVQLTTLIRLVTIGGDSQLQEVNTMCAININNRPIHQSNELYSLNDLFKASGSNTNDKPSNFLRLKQTQELIAEISNCSDVSNKDLIHKKVAGRYGGTYAHKYLVYAYAMWISPKFHLHVIKAFDNQQSTNSGQLEEAKPKSPSKLGRVVKGVMDDDANQEGMSCFPDEYIETLYKRINTASHNYKVLAQEFEKFKDLFYQAQKSFHNLSAWNEIITFNPKFEKVGKK